jgi:hypothetical protein
LECSQTGVENECNFVTNTSNVIFGNQYQGSGFLEDELVDFLGHGAIVGTRISSLS